MSTYKNSRILDWQPPKRPEWVERINEEGHCMDIKSVVPLDENSLIDCAKANTGLTDFGPEDWRESFQLFLESLNEEAELNLMGRLMTRSELLMYLEARLKVEDICKQHPEIEEQELAPQILITGSGRSGTSAIQNLMSHDPDNGTPRHWEALFPCPPPETDTYETDPRIAIADKRMNQYNRVCPSMAGIHEWGGDMPTENIQLEAMTFQSIGWMCFSGHTPSWEQYMYQKADNLPALRHMKRMLKILQWKNPRKRWLMKNPSSIQMLPETFEVFPDLKILWMHRDPIKTISSMVSLAGTIYWTRSDKPLGEKAIEHLTNPQGLAELYNLVISQIENKEVPAENIYNVQYGDFIKDPLETVLSTYRNMGIAVNSDSEQAMQKYISDNPRENRPAHNYNVGDAEVIQQERMLFEKYMDYFDVSKET